MPYRDSDYYLTIGRIVKHVVCRASNGRPVPDSKNGTWLATVRDLPGGQIEVTKNSPQVTPRQLDEILLLHRGVWDRVNSAVDFSPQIPTPIVAEFTQKVASVASIIRQQYRQLGPEPGMVGAFFSQLAGRYISDGWELDVDYQNFSPINKEPFLGADASVIIDMITDRGQRLLKAIWFQAKRADQIPGNLWSIPDLQGQMNTMDRHTTAGHALVFSPEGLVAASTAEVLSPRTIENVLEETLMCNRGDRSARTLANSFDMRIVVELIISPLPPRVRRSKARPA